MQLCVKPAAPTVPLASPNQQRRRARGQRGTVNPLELPQRAVDSVSRHLKHAGTARLCRPLLHVVTPNLFLRGNGSFPPPCRQ